MSPDPTKIFSFLSSSSLVTQGTGMPTKAIEAEENDLFDDHSPEFVPSFFELSTHSAQTVPSLAPCSVGTTSTCGGAITCSEEDDGDSSQLSLSPVLAAVAAKPTPQLRRLKSILKPASAYGVEAAKINPRSLRRGFQSMLELPTLLPEDGVCEAPIVDMVPPAMLDSSLNGHVDAKPTLHRKLSFSSERSIKRIESNNELDDSSKSERWFQREEITEFVGEELTRRGRMGIASQKTLCPAAEEDEAANLKRRANANMPRGVRR